MSKQLKRIVLASASPRRLDTLRQFGLEPEVIAADVDEQMLENEDPRDYVVRVARDKAQAIVERTADAEQVVIIAADTSVVIGGQTLGKPLHAEDGERMLRSMSGTEHTVLSAVVVAGGGVPMTHRLAETRVWMRESTRQERADYWATGEPQDKAGGYAIQGIGSVFVERIEGNYATVVGLPVHELSTLLALHGIDLITAAREGN